jgi:OmpR-family two-component system manganese-sensing sensor histidine kinase
MFQATRRRLALWYTLVTAILLLLFASGVYSYVRYTLVDRVDDTLKHVVEVIERSLVVRSLPVARDRYQVNIEGSFRNNDIAIGDDHIDLEWFSPQGELIWSTLTENSPVPLRLNRTAETVVLDEDRFLRQVTKRVERDRQVLGYLRVSHPWFEVSKPIRQLLWDLSLGTIVMSLCVAAIGWWLSGIAIQPVKDSYQRLKQFTADASHELRNPIATIQTHAQMTLACADADPQWQQQQLRVIERLTQRLGYLVNDLLFLARSDSGMLQSQNQTVALDALLVAVIEEQRLRAKQLGIELLLDIVTPSESQTDADRETYPILGDWDQLARLFTNLICNALDYAYGDALQKLAGAKVVVTLEKIKVDRASRLQVKIRDWGCGIEAKALPHLFDRFYRADPARSHLNATAGGTGLGLAIARAIADRHQGMLIVDSQPGQGTCFTATFPIGESVRTALS